MKSHGAVVPPGLKQTSVKWIGLRSIWFFVRGVFGLRQAKVTAGWDFDQSCPLDSIKFRGTQRNDG